MIYPSSLVGCFNNGTLTDTLCSTIYSIVGILDRLLRFIATNIKVNC